MNTPVRSSSRRRNRACLGVSSAEMMTGLFLTTTILAGVSTVSLVTARAAEDTKISATLSTTQQTAADEILYQLRAGSEVVTSSQINGITYTTGANSIVFKASAYNASTGGSILTGQNDVIVFSYDSQAKALRETTVPAIGSLRGTRNRFKLAKNVTGVTFSYLARDQFTAMTSGTTTYTLNTRATATPTVYVNGEVGTCTYNSTTRVATVTNTPLGADIQFQYTVDPSSSDALLRVSQVNVSVTVAATNNRQSTQTITLSGAARLRNCRL